ncbi:uncharacterized protein LACBIDRAFT_309043 [Laccaria bicolor S238N-H82]|uniref:U6 snRNA phosphodiesterase n=1 Tax=Laccaria bicolor (strain S238N-H82 / ATCC MYA-4686) TaxID=486041 RepID=B0CVE5_LACBS|nr:uncharacterized protein LACBIDRAFT_309043 [Laccaria bicolor S238N-H82]EDR13734.1 predicted protein [Laccaria bicolor S238N-H82]|eukprot:XP_001876232.1 predicted protein [Laccaria bicolor S238N-H82]
MKRCSALLVNYSSSDDESDNNDSRLQAGPVPKKRKLPVLPLSIAPPVPLDDPSLHQGRIRTIPHVDGQFASHIYIALPLGREQPLLQLLRDILREAKESVPYLYEIGFTSEEKTSELHISLSRPIFLRVHQREDLKKALRALARRQKKFTLSFATFSELVNDEKTRTFLTMEVGAGHHELQNLAEALSPALQGIRQKEYYTNPRFHASIAWAHLDRPGNEDNLDLVTASPSKSSKLEIALDLGPEGVELHSVPHLPNELLMALNERYCTRLASPKIGMFDVEKIHVKIGREVFSWFLEGM